MYNVDFTIYVNLNVYVKCLKVSIWFKWIKHISLLDRGALKGFNWVVSAVGQTLENQIEIHQGYGCKNNLEENQIE